MGDLVEKNEMAEQDRRMREAIKKSFAKKPEDMNLKEYLMYQHRRYRQRMEYIGMRLRRW
jgi:polyhydroxyalkanoate synthesis regulator protein